MMKTESVQQFWKEFTSQNPEINVDESFQIWFFGNDSVMARELVELVI